MYKKIIILLFVLSGIFLSCKHEEKENTDNIPQKIDTVEIYKDIKNVFYSMPSPLEIASIVKKYKQNFSPDILNDINKAKNYMSTKAQAINLGIYSADIAFLTISGNNQYSKEYFSVLVYLANDLDITEGINDTLLKSIENNINNIEKVKELMSLAFFKSDAFLKENSKQKITTYILNGSWIESVYIILSLAKGEALNSDIYHLLIDQRLILENIFEIDKKQNFEKKYLKRLTKLKQLFNNCVVITKKEVKDPYTDSLRTKTYIKYDFDTKKIKKISEEIIKIRENFVSLQ